MLRIRHAIARGFTLIEVAIVLVVIGLLLSGGLLAVAPVLESARLAETQDKMDIVEDALVLYAIRNNCLPCPADATDIGSGTAGQASQNPGTGATYTTGCATVTTGTCDTTGAAAIVPWVNLGLSQGDVTDGFGNMLGYHIRPTDTVVYRTGTSGGQLVRSGTTYQEGSLDVNDIDGLDVTALAAYVLVSYGTDGSLAYAQSGSQRAATANTAPDQVENTDGDEFFIQGITEQSLTGDYYDDILRFKTGPLIIQQCGSGACGNP